MNTKPCRHVKALSPLVMGLPIALGLLTSSAGAQQFWRDRKSSEWTSTEAKVMVSQSPWARPTKLQTKGTPSAIPAGNRDVAPSTTVDAGGLPQVLVQHAEKVGESNRDLIALLESGAPLSPPSDTTLPTELGGVPIPRDAVVVLWESALPIQEAKAKLGMRDVVKDQVAAYIVVSIIGYPFMLMNSEGQAASARTREWILESAALVRKGKGRIEPADVHVTASEDTVIVRFFFPRNKSIQPEDKEVTFWFQIDTTLVQTKFNLQEMVYQGKPAL
ncbi:MAG: hypothetical protein ACRD50_07320 [Candidatus Acidiferrales bacterium]